MEIEKWRRPKPAPQGPKYRKLPTRDWGAPAQWKPAYKRGYSMQATLATVGFLLGLLSWWLTSRLAFIAGAVLMVANWPWTMFGIMPTNRALMMTALPVQGLIRALS